MKGRSICKTLLLCLVLCAFVLTAAVADVEKDEDGGVWDWDKGIYTSPDGSTYNITGNGDDGGSSSSGSSSSSSGNTSTPVVVQEPTNDTGKSENKEEPGTETKNPTDQQQNSGIIKDEDGGTWDWDKGIYTAPDGSTYNITGDGDDSGSTSSSSSSSQSTPIVVEQEQTKGTSASENIGQTSVETTKLTGWQQNNGKWYYFNSSGVIYNKGWLKVDGKWYYFRSNGEMATGWVEDQGEWYYLSKSGAMYTGWLKDGNDWYLLKRNGAMAKGWANVDGSWYYFSRGAMVTGWQKINGKWEMFSKTGAWLYTWNGKY